MSNLDPRVWLATEVVLSAIEDLKKLHRQKEIDFFLDPKKSEMWIVAAGLDYDATISRLRADGHFVAAPPKLTHKSVAKAVAVSRTTYQIEMERRVLLKMPTAPDTACSASRLADYVGVYRKVVRTALDGLKARGKADCRSVPLRGGTTLVWWRISQEI